MAKPEIFTFEYKEVAELLVKQQDIHEGHWAIVFELGLAAGSFSRSLPTLKTSLQRPSSPLRKSDFRDSTSPPR